MKSSTRSRKPAAEWKRGVIRQQVIEQLMREIMNYDAEFRREETTSTVSSHAKH